jgi:hypothetical protein
MAILALVVITGLILVSCGGGGGGDSAPVNNEVSYTASGLGTGTTYYWKVVAVDGKGGISQSSVRSFTTR